MIKPIMFRHDAQASAGGDPFLAPPPRIDHVRGRGGSVVEKTREKMIMTMLMIVQSNLIHNEIKLYICKYKIYLGRHDVIPR
jgi:hypothetical protein